MNNKLEIIKNILQERQEKQFSLSLTERIHILNQLKKMLIVKEENILEALEKDLGKSYFEAYASELSVLLNEIDHVLKHLKKWTKKKQSYRFKLGTIEKVESKRTAYGTVLVISPWNYPLQLSLMPVINALSAGNSCVIKPSEHAEATGHLLKELIDQYFVPEQLCVITGEANRAQELIELPFDLLIFTGSEKVGQLVYQQAAKSLMPVILELGGKNPCIIDETGFSEAHIEEIVWGKFLNAGQTCIAPDTLFVHESIYQQTLEVLKDKLIQFYGEDPIQSTDYSRLIHENQYNRLKKLLTKSTIYYGGKTNRHKLFIEPTLITDNFENNHWLQEEIFGPILPVVPYTELDTLLASNQFQKDALVTYLFSKNSTALDKLNKTVKSTVSMNQVIQYATNPQVAFGGVGRSGFGAYHGEAGFKSFTYERSFIKSFTYKRFNNKYPPYNEKDLPLLKRLRRWII